MGPVIFNKSFQHKVSCVVNEGSLVSVKYYVNTGFLQEFLNFARLKIRRIASEILLFRINCLKGKDIIACGNAAGNLIYTKQLSSIPFSAKPKMGWRMGEDALFPSNMGDAHAYVILPLPGHFSRYLI
jgi:hypothetical protein